MSAREHLKFCYPDKLDNRLIMGMYQYEDWIWKQYPFARVVIHNDWAETGHLPDSQHYLGKACDFHVDGVPLVDAWLACERVVKFTGIGIYTDWKTPGLHADVRDEDVRARWWRKDDVYVAADRWLLAALLGKESQT